MTATLAGSRLLTSVKTRVIRADIQALRAAAVGLVVLNHLWPQHLSGGYIGVDIFFVISGYLITAHLRREISTTRRIDLPRFWARRANRLLPAALLVLFATIVITAIWLPITNRQAAYDQIGAAGTYVLNWILAATSMDYFAHDTAQSPVTHYWSLSVEEQFYIVWPLLIVACLAFARRRSTRVLDASIAGALGLVFIGSLAWGTYSAATAGSAAYFETTGRAWEFAVGGLLAFAPAAARRAHVWMIPVAWVAWGAIAFAAWKFDATSGFPGPLALVPVLAAAALIWLGDIDHAWSPKGITSLGPVQLIGDISYSIYLWHWPLIVAAPFMLQRDITAKDKLVILAITLVLAYVSKRYVEDPMRSSRSSFWVRPRNVLVATAASMALLLAVTIPMSGQVNSQAQASARVLHAASVEPDQCFGAQAVLSGADCADSHELDDPFTVLAAWGVQNASVSNGTYCMQVRGNPEIVDCSFGLPEGQQTTNVALVGDSHAGMWATAFDAIAENRGLRITAYLNSACPVTLDPEVIGPQDHIPSHQSACRTWREDLISHITADPGIDVVVTSNRDRTYRKSDGTLDDGQGYVKAWSSWLNAGKQVIVLNDAPIFPVSVPECIAESLHSARECTVPAAAISTPGPMEIAASQIDDARFSFVDYTEVFCDSDRCHSVIGGIPAYLDTEHLTAAFARSFGSDFLADTAIPHLQ